MPWLLALTLTHRLGPILQRTKHPLLPLKSRASLRLSMPKTRLPATQGPNAKTPASKCTNPGKKKSAKAKPMAQNGQPRTIFCARQGHGSPDVPVGTLLRFILGPTSLIRADAERCAHLNEPPLENVGHHITVYYYFIIFKFNSACNSS